jgi:hypothetical protein
MFLTPSNRFWSISCSIYHLLMIKMIKMIKMTKMTKMIKMIKFNRGPHQYPMGVLKICKSRNF